MARKYDTMASTRGRKRLQRYGNQLVTHILELEGKLYDEISGSDALQLSKVREYRELASTMLPYVYPKLSTMDFGDSGNEALRAFSQAIRQAIAQPGEWSEPLTDSQEPQVGLLGGGGYDQSEE